MSGSGRNIVVIGTSAGGLDVLDHIFGQLPTDLSASIFIVQHLAAENTGLALLHRLGQHKGFACKLAEDGEIFKPGKIYIAPAEFHMLVRKTRILVTKGARENRYRPAVDPLFRSAAVTHGHRVIGIVLTGMLDDGTAGLVAIKKCGGVTVVQDPNDAAYSDMPRNALENLRVDHCVPASEIGGLIDKLTREHAGKSQPVPDEIRVEAKIAERVLSDVAQVDSLGNQAPYNCPNCGGVLWEIKKSKNQRYRCHTGHSFTAASLLVMQSEKIEETLWTSLRMFEERKNLLTNMAKRGSGLRTASSYAKRAEETEIHIERIRAMLLSSETTGSA